MKKLCVSIFIAILMLGNLIVPATVAHAAEGYWKPAPGGEFNDLFGTFQITKITARESTASSSYYAADIEITINLKSKDAYDRLEGSGGFGGAITRLEIKDARNGTNTYFLKPLIDQSQIGTDQTLKISTDLQKNKDGFIANLAPSTTHTVRAYLEEDGTNDTVWAIDQSGDAEDATFYTGGARAGALAEEVIVFNVGSNIAPSGRSAIIPIIFQPLIPAQDYLELITEPAGGGRRRFKANLTEAQVLQAGTRTAQTADDDYEKLGTYDLIEGDGVNDGEEGVMLEISTDRTMRSGVITVPFYFNIFWPAGQTQTRLIDTGTVLQPNTTYYVRGRLDENTSANVRYTDNIIAFTTDPEVADDEQEDRDSTSQQQENFTDADIKPRQGELPGCIDLTNFNLAGCIANIIHFAIYQPATFILGISGSLFDFMLGFTTDSDSYDLANFVEEGWKVMRDIANMVFIFILLYTAIGIVLNLHNVNGPKMIGMVIIIGLLINFSLFFSKVVIDSSNILARVFYNGLTITNKDTGEAAESASHHKAISVAIADKLEVGSMTLGWQEGQIKVRNADGKVVPLEGTEYAAVWIIILLLASAVALIAAYTFFIVSFLFVGRVIGLWIVMITAPIAFMSYTLPKGISIPSFGHKEWWKELLGLSFVAPIFLFFLFLILKFLQIPFLEQIYQQNQDGQALDTMQFILAIIVPFIIIIVLLTRARKLAQDLAGKAGSFLVDNALKIAGLAAGAATGGAALAARSTLGRASDTASKNEKLRDLAAGTRKTFNDSKWDTSTLGGKIAQRGARIGNLVGKRVAQGGLAAANRGREASFDARNNAVANKISQEAKIPLNYGLGAIGLSTKTTAGGFAAKQQRDQQKLEKKVKEAGYNQEQAAVVEKDIKGQEKALKEMRDAFAELKEQARVKKITGEKISDEEKKALIDKERDIRVASNKLEDRKEDLDVIKNARKNQIISDTMRRSDRKFTPDKTDAEGRIEKLGKETGEYSARGLLEALGSGFAKGAVIGGAVGNIVPGFGTVTGALTGGVVGALKTATIDYNGRTNRSIAEHLAHAKEKKGGDKGKKFQSKYKNPAPEAKHEEHDDHGGNDDSHGDDDHH